MTWNHSVKGGAGSAVLSGSVRAVQPAFADMLSALEITDAERKQAAAQQLTLRDRLRGALAVVIDYLSGSYRRHTNNRPLDDIDVLLVLCLATYPWLRARTREAGVAALAMVEQALKRAYPGCEVTIYDRCVRIKFAGTGIGFDVTPAIRFTGAGLEDEFWIPDTTLGRWIPTNPKAVEKLMNEANARCGGRLVPLVKALKHWKDLHDVPLRGFQLEAMAYRALQSAPVDDRQGIAFLFNALASAIYGGIPDIWPYGEPADASLSPADRAKAAVALRDAALAADRAVRAEAWGDPAAAHREWFGLFGAAYPESGEARSAPAPVHPFDAVGGSRSGARVSATSSGIVSAFAGLGSYASPTSHGGAVAAPELDATPVASDHGAWLDADIALALRQFPGLMRLDPAAAAADPTLGPVGPWNVDGLHAVLVGTQRTNFGITHRIMVTVPKAAPAVECRVFLLSERRRFRPGPDGRFVPWRPAPHRWGDGALCTHALRDRCDGRLTTLLVYAAEWLLRYDYYQMTGVWVGRELVGRGQLRRNGRPVTSTTGKAGRRPGRR